MDMQILKKFKRKWMRKRLKNRKLKLMKKQDMKLN
jgi:hypothetical protein